MSASAVSTAVLSMVLHHELGTARKRCISLVDGVYSTDIRSARTNP